MYHDVNLAYFCSPITDIESLITEPQLYIFGRSQSSIKDQALYSSTRLEHLSALKPSYTKTGLEYNSVLKLGTGTLATNVNKLRDDSYIIGHIPNQTIEESQEIFHWNCNYSDDKFAGLEFYCVQICKIKGTAHLARLSFRKLKIH